MAVRKLRRVSLSRVVGIAALFSGAALLTHILVRASLALALLVTTCLLAAAVAAVWRRAGPAERARLLRVAKVGLAAGVSATLVYDGAKFALSQWDPSPYNPFEAAHRFGLLLIGPGAGEVAIWSTGTAFHLLNGVAFGTAFCFLLGTRGAVAGVLWGLFLETFQLTLYPGWLDIRFYNEFVQISALSHVAYGATLGLVAKRMLEN